MKFDLRGRACLVTGASSGIGKEIARNLAYFGATVILGCRDRHRGSEALEEIVEDSGNDHVRLMLVDLSSPSSIRAFVRNFQASGDPLHVLVNNAAVLAGERTMTPEGFELTWATNVLGYFLLTELLMEQLRASRPARIINVASKFAGKLDLTDVNFERRRWSSTAAYAQSKQADRMLTWAWAKQTSPDKLGLHCCHPGGVNTPIYRNQTGLFAKLIKWGSPFLRTPAHGALTPTWLASDPELDGAEPGFWVNRRRARCKYRKHREIDALFDLCGEQVARKR